MAVRGIEGFSSCSDWMGHEQACKLKFKLRDFTLCLCSTAALAVCFEGSAAVVNATESLNLH